MKSHRLIWSVVGIVVLSAALVLFGKEAGEWAGEHRPGAGRILSGKEADRLIATMLACLERDPQARRDKTQLVVRAVAALAESGARQTAETYYALGLRLAAEQRLLDDTDPTPNGSPTGWGTQWRFRDAEKAYRDAIALRPDWNWPYNSLGILLHTMGRTKEAEEAFRMAIERDPAWSRPHNDLAILLRLTQRLDEAEKEAQVALKLEPDSVATNNNYGNLLVELKRFDDAEQAYRKAITFEPDHPAPYYNLACLASLRGNRDDALSYLNCAVVLDEALRDEAGRDADFDTIRSDPEFRALVYGEGA